jgi:hypothetical protein
MGCASTRATCENGCVSQIYNARLRKVSVRVPIQGGPLQLSFNTIHCTLYQFFPRAVRACEVGPRPVVLATLLGARHRRVPDSATKDKDCKSALDVGSWR